MLHRLSLRCALATAMAFFLALGQAASAEAKTVKVKLKGGDVVSGELISENERETVIEHPLFGRLVVPREKQSPRDGEQPGLFGTGLLAGWQKELGVGITGQEGNSPEANFLVTGRLDRKVDTWRYHLDGDYKLGTESKSRTSNYANLRTRYDRLFPGSRWFAALGGLYQFDEFEPWEHRVQVLAGPGYHLLQREELSIDLLGGPAYLYEFGDRNQGRPEVFLGVDLTYKPMDGHRLRLGHYFLQGLKESEWRMRTDLEWRMRILGTEHLGLVFGFRNEYDTAAEDEPNNLKYWSRLSYEF